jgi:cyanophycinase-like exopeptidase
MKSPYGPNEVEADATALREAMKGNGTDKKAIIAIVANRSHEQRMQIATKYCSLYENVAKI